MKKKVLAALSGGVDSGVAAALLVEQGYDVTGVHLKLGSVEGSENKCCDTGSFNRVVALCDQLKIPLKVLDFSEKFASVVIHEFLEDYRRGLTPNPCVVCNKEIKIGGLLAWALKNGFDFLATGHYVRVKSSKCKVQNCESEFSLLQAVDKKKDQSYFLWTLRSEQIAYLLFPVGEMSKDMVRKEAVKSHLPVAEAKESFDVCFIPGDDTQKYLKLHLPSGSFGPGKVVNSAEEVIGSHFGLPLYTIGQHRGFTITSKKYASRVLYVVSKDVRNNLLLVGSKSEAEVREFKVRGMRDMSGRTQASLATLFLRQKNVGVVDGVDLTVRVRHRGVLVEVKSLSEEISDDLSESLDGSGSKRLNVVLSEPILGVAPGQSAVFYRGEELVGGGIIC